MGERDREVKRKREEESWMGRREEESWRDEGKRGGRVGGTGWRGG